MGLFTEAEIAYLQKQRLGRLATVTKTGNPHVVPVSFLYNPEFESIDIVGRTLPTSLKYKNIVINGRVAFVVDDIASLSPYLARMIEIRGYAEIVLRDENDPLPHALEMSLEMRRTIARNVAPEMIRIRAKRIISAGLGSNPLSMSRRTIADDGSVTEARTPLQPIQFDAEK
ncbi:PPOX class F420-dependent oxidoreductase [Ktedonosporobacter rubrisoli]|uniref:PPOX class F420-dependent oxidoreductase n=1 Tax=Ktedonosporobacter rubrisoli TaxID=2509675 RepID=A0A4V0YYK5_KTERU|nr:PPOX class F420-dependent oxidoreductase [Ktedonosporobacter rubrisoli]QBD76541.1 PPOX class F420-dependent oxidoreductase [Ktedonosporobacter rubrisoli]